MSYFIDICLICLKHSDNLQYSKFQDTNGMSFDDKLEDFIPGYGLDLNIPTYICAQCSRILNKIYDFKRKCLRNKATYKKYAQQITTTDSSYKYLSVVINPDLIDVKDEIPDENNCNIDILEHQTEINVDTVKIEEIIIKEEENEKFVLDDKSQSLLHEIKQENFESDDTHNQNENIIEGTTLIANNVEYLNHDLKQDMREICDVKLYKCETCNKTFKNPKKLKKHQSIHRNYKPYACEVCGKSFRHPSDLKRHRSVHFAEKPFTCDVCNKSFTQSVHLKMHKVLHTDEKLFVCEVCNKSFTRTSHLKEHKRIHTIGEFTCEVCNKSFTDLSNFKKHTSVHTSKKRFTCEVCNKLFNKLSNLKRHKTQHTGEKPFTCDVCNKSFGQASHLKEHNLVHTGQKPFSCEVCNKSFQKVSNLKRHKLVHTSENHILVTLATNHSETCSH